MPLKPSLINTPYFLTQKPLAEIPVKLRDLFLELRSYNYTTLHIAGARYIISDTLSRAVKWAPKKTQDEKDEHKEMDYEASKGIERAFARNVTSKENKRGYLWKDPLLEEVINQAGKDGE